MRRYIFFVFAVFFAGTFLGGCGNEEGDDNSRGFHSGKQSFEDLENNMAAILSFFDLSLRMNAYLERPEEVEVETLPGCFPDYQIIRNDEGEWLGLKGQDTVFRVVTDGLALTMETAVWKLDGCCEAYHGVMTIVCTGLGTWTLETNSVVNGIWKSKAFLRVKYQGEHMPLDFNRGNWMISGNGESMIEDEEKEGNSEIMRFEIGESLIKTGESKYLFDKGVLYLTVQNPDDERQELVKTELKSFSAGGRQLQITSRGVEKIYYDEGLPTAAGSSATEASSAETTEGTAATVE